MAKLEEPQMKLYFDLNKKLSKENYVKLFDNHFISFRHAYSETDRNDIEKMISDRNHFKFSYGNNTITVRVANLVVEQPTKAISSCSVDLVRI